jgi:hypothetical protein
MTTGPTCSICTDPRRAEIDLARGSIGDVARRFDVARSTLHRHRQHTAQMPLASRTSPSNGRVSVGRPGQSRRPAQRQQSAAGVPRSPLAEGPPERIDLREELEAIVRRARRDVQLLDEDSNAQPKERAAANMVLLNAAKALSRAGEEEPKQSPLERALTLRQRDALADLNAALATVTEAQARRVEPEKLRRHCISVVDAMACYVSVPGYDPPRPLAAAVLNAIKWGAQDLAATFDEIAAQRGAMP